MFGFLSPARSITRIAIEPVAAAPGRAGVAIVVILRNEERHVAEWARFHLAAGAAHFFVYDNGCTDHTLAELARVAAGRATVIPWRAGFKDARRGAELHAQVLAYAHALRNFGSPFRWMAFIDVDEFLVPKDASLPAALAHLSDCRSISLPWHMFGRNGHATPPDGGILPNYLRRAADPMGDARGVRNFKCIVDPSHVTCVGVHDFDVDGSGDTCNDRGVRFSNKGREGRAFYSVDHLQLNHYYARSEAEVAEKIARGVFPASKSAGHGRRIRTIIGNIEADEVKDRAATLWWQAHNDG
jgi:hypothetical protein